MNGKQIKIFIINILPGVIVKSILVISSSIILGLMVIKIFLVPAENKKYKEQMESIRSQKKLFQMNKEKQDIGIFLNKLYIPIEGWEVIDNGLDEKYKNGSILLRNKNEDIVSLMCASHDYITDILEYSIYQNEKLVRNMSSEGVILTSKITEDIEFNNISAVKETFNDFYKPTGKKSTLITITFKHLDYFYTIQASETNDTYLLISKMKLED